jgi:hypothetical protein
MVAAAKKAGVNTIGCFLDFDFGARNQEVLEAIDRSNRSGAWVSTKPKSPMQPVLPPNTNAACRLRNRRGWRRFIQLLRTRCC